jgi:intein/homing endonuclease
LTYHPHGDCLCEDTEILLGDGTTITIGDWATKYPDQELVVKAYDEQRDEFVNSIGSMAREGQVVDELYEIEMEDGSIIKCSADHPFFSSDREDYISAKDLKEGEELKTM